MVERQVDSGVVTAKIRRETRAFAEEKAAEGEALSAAPSAAPAEAVLTVESVPTPSAPPPDPERAFRLARLGIVAVLVLVFFWAWLRQRRGR